MEGTATLIAVIAVAVVLGFMVVTNVRVVPEWARLVVFRLGRTGPELVRGPGLRLLMPIVDRGFMVDLRERRTIPLPMTVTSADNRSLHASFAVRWRIVDALKSKTSVLDFEGALRGVASTQLKVLVSEASSDEALFHPERISDALLAHTDEVARGWGGKVLAIDDLVLSKS
jgi:regulator of protease activity HflC (stomatin/prohibitin superfamily)